MKNAMTRSIDSDLADQICEFLTFAYDPAHRKNLEEEARKMKVTYEQFLAMGMTQMILERFQVTRIGDENQSTDGRED